MRRAWLHRQCANLLGALTIASAPGTGNAASSFSAHVEGGLGVTEAHPLPSPSTLGAMLSAGVGLPMRRGRMTFEVAWSYGDDTGGGNFPGPVSGERSLTTLLMGVEAINKETARGFYAGLGAGLGHATLEGAMSRFVGPGDRSIPDRTLTGFAFGAGAGVRSFNGPGPLGLDLSVRFHALVNAGEIAASATMLTLGLAY
jgi:hypothetical protein